MSKIYRYYDKEETQINIPWIELFARELEARNNGIDYLQQLFQQTSRFNSIDEKMADIKQRIGFDLINKVSEELEKHEKIASQKEPCECGGSCGCKVKTASYKHPQKDVDQMQVILSYIRDMAKSEPHLDPATVISRCREEDGLRFGDLRINMTKLKDFIGEQLEKHHGEGDSEAVVVYVPQEPISSGEAEDNIAEYYRSSEK